MLPPLAGVTRLEVHTLRDAVAVPLGGMPRLQELTLAGSKGSCYLMRGQKDVGVAGELTSLEVDAGHLLISFGYTPTLRRLAVSTGSLVGSGTLGAAAALTALRLGRSPGRALPDGWPADLLAAAAGSLRSLSLIGAVHGRLSEAVGRLRQLEQLSLCSNAIQQPLASAPLWAGLRDLWWDHRYGDFRFEVRVGVGG